MKKLIAYAMSAAILCTILCGCGSAQTGDGNTIPETPNVSQQQGTSPAPTVSPMISPDMEDGIVDDRDGIMEDDNESGSNSGSSTSTNRSTTGNAGSTAGTTGGSGTSGGSTSGTGTSAGR